jgi:hypothetical protein
LLSQLLTNSHFHSLMTVELVIFLKCCFSFPRSSSSHVSFNWCEHQHTCLLNDFQTLHYFLTYCTLILPAGDEFPCKQHVSPMKTELHYRLFCGTKLPVSLLLHINLSPQEHLNDCCAVCCMLALLQVLLFTKK